MADQLWHPTSNAKLGTVICDYKRGNYPFLPLQFGETVQIFEENGGWYRGFSVLNKHKKGIFPASHVHLKPADVQDPGPREIVTPKEDPIVGEIQNALLEWCSSWKELFVHCNRPAFSELYNKMRDLIEWRRQVLTQSFTKDEMRELKQKISLSIDGVNKELSLDVVPREESGEVINPKDISIVRLYKVMKSQEERHSAPPSLTISGSVQLKSQSGEFNIWLKLELLKLQLRHRVEVVITVYDKRLQQHITEPYLEVLTEKGLPVDNEKIGCTFALFTDFDQTDRNNRDLYLVCKVIKLCNEMEKGRNFCSEVRLPYGIGVYPLKDVLSGVFDELEEGKSFHMQINQSIQRFSSDFAKLQDYVIANDRTNCSPLQDKGNGLFGSVKVINGPLDQARAGYPLLIKKNTAISRKFVFSDAARSGEKRHDIFMDLVSGFFDKGTKKADKNVEIQISVVDERGKIVEGMVSGGQGAAPVNIYKTVIFYHTAQCSFVDSIRVHVQPEFMEKYSVKFVCGHMSAGNRPKFDSHALGYIKLVTKDGTAVPDGFHDVQLYSYKEAIQGANYLKEQWECGDKARQPKIPVIVKDSLKVKTTICSTELTQNADLLFLLRWQMHKSHLSDVLAGVKNITGDEILKFLTVTLDAVFNILEEVSDEEANLAFQALVYILSTILERRFAQHRGLLDQYIAKTFSRPQVYPKLMAKLKASFREVMLPDKERQLDNDILVKTMKAAEYLVKFIVKSRQQYSDQTRGRNRELFSRDIRDMLVTFFEMIKFQFPQSDVVAPRSQALALTFFPTTLKDLLNVVHRPLLSGAIAEFLFKLNPSRLPGFKATFLQSLVSSELFCSQESRLVLLPAVLRQLKVHILSMDDQLRLCLDVLQEVISIVYKQRPENAKEEVQILVVHILQTLYTVYKNMKEEADKMKEQRTPFRLASVVVCLLGILQLMAEAHFRWCINIDDKMMSEQKFENFIHQSFYIFHDMTDRTLFPLDWSVMFLLMNSILTNTTQHIMDLISADMLGSKDGQGSMSFNHSLWRNFFQFAVSFCVQESLQLEKFTEAKCTRVLGWYGDMRVVMNDLMVTYWKQLGVLRIRFIPEMVGPFLQVSLLPHPGLRKRTIPLFYDMMDIYRKDGFHVLELEMTEKLDTFITRGHGDIEFKKSLEELLIKRCKENKDMVARGGLDFIMSLSKLLDRLFDFRSIAVVEHEVNNDLRMHVMFNLLNFYKEMGREEMYIRYIYRLAEMQKASGSYVEAAFTLLLHARLLQWTNDKMSPEGPYPEQTSAQRKNALFNSITDLFDKGKLWECGIEQCRELIAHEVNNYDYSRLSELHMRMSKLYDKIITEIRADSQYFRVCFYGGFPPFFKDKIFIFRGLEYEQLASFNERLSTIFPRAKFMKSLDPPDGTIRQSPDQYLQCCVVTPLPEGLEKFEGKHINEQIVKFYRSNNVKKFLLKRGLHKGPKDKKNEFVSLFLECTTYTTAESFPGIMRWFEVVVTDVTELNPVENGIETVKENATALQGLIKRLESDSTASSNPLTMKLQGILDAAVAGGLKNYEIFFTEEYQRNHPDYVKSTEILKEKMIALCKVCGRGLKLHGRVCTTAMRKLHEHMEIKYDEFKKKYGSQGDEDPYEPLKQGQSSLPPGPPRTPDSIPPSLPLSRPGSMVLDDASTKNSPASEKPPPIPTKQRPRSRAQTIAVSNQRPMTPDLSSSVPTDVPLFRQGTISVMPVHQNGSIPQWTSESKERRADSFLYSMFPDKDDDIDEIPPDDTNL